MPKKIITKISEGLGNQLFMYANSYSLSKKFDLDFYIDQFSGYYKKNVYKFMLDNFNISSKKAPTDWVFSNNYDNFFKKIYMKLDYLKKKKSFLFEKRNHDKSTFFSPIQINNTDEVFYIDGNFETEKYFINYKNQLINEFSIKNNKKFYNNQYLNMVKSNNTVSICIRQNRFSERIFNRKSTLSKAKSDQFVKDTAEYIHRAIDLIKSKVKNPKFLLWSNDFNNLDEYFPPEQFIYINNNEDKIITDFYLLTQCKNFIVAPSTFNWWGAWLSERQNKICIRPKNLNLSNNKDFWPDSWISI